MLQYSVGLMKSTMYRVRSGGRAVRKLPFEMRRSWRHCGERDQEIEPYRWESGRLWRDAFFPLNFGRFCWVCHATSRVVITADGHGHGPDLHRTRVCDSPLGETLCKQACCLFPEADRGARVRYPTLTMRRIRRGRRRNLWIVTRLTAIK